MAKPEYVRGMSATNADYFEKGRGHGSDYDKGSNQYTGNTQLKEGFSRVAHQDAPDPVAYTQTRTARKGGGFDLGEKQYIYEKVKQNEAPAAPEAPQPDKAPEPSAPEGPIELSPEVQQAKERVNAYQNSIDGTAGSLFASDNAEPAVENDAEKEAQGFADKYKLNLMDGVGLDI